jgi:hypothetical protein
VHTRQKWAALAHFCTSITDEAQLFQAYFASGMADQARSPVRRTSPLKNSARTTRWLATMPGIALMRVPVMHTRSVCAMYADGHKPPRFQGQVTGEACRQMYWQPVSFSRENKKKSRGTALENSWYRHDRHFPTWRLCLILPGFRSISRIVPSSEGIGSFPTARVLIFK